MSTESSAEAPRWQLDTIFPGLESPDFAHAQQRAGELLAELEHLVARSRIREGVTATAADASTAERFLDGLNAASELLMDLIAYVHCRTDTNSFDEAAQAMRSTLQPLLTRYRIAAKEFTAWVSTLPLDTAAAASSVVAAHRYGLGRAQRIASHLLPGEAETLVEALSPTGGGAWGRLHDALISRETIRVALPGRAEEEYGVAQLTNLQGDPDPATRRAAWQAQLALLERNAIGFAAAMNSIKGEVGELAARRGWDSPLAESLFQNSISAEALAAMQQACSEAFPLLRRYLHAKARHLGKERLGWYDLEAPVGAAARHYGWEEARDFVVRHFGSFSTDLAAFARRAFDEGWLDGPPARGKTNGAYCVDVPGRRESRILLNFGGRLDDLFTIAHELGHAWHNECMYRAERTPLQSESPMTMAETASIFCETLILAAVLEDAAADERLAILDRDLTGTALLLLDIHSRFLFESGVFARRRERELSQAELDRLMLDAQESTYGDGLAQDERHRLMWALKGHYYSSSRSFYNYPYTFGYLFGLGLYGEYLRRPEGFTERYDHLLASTGMADADELAAGFGIDLEDPAFWRRGLEPLAARVAEYEELVGAARQPA